jgi:hypothetical protein
LGKLKIIDDELFELMVKIREKNDKKEAVQHSYRNTNRKGSDKAIAGIWI